MLLFHLHSVFVPSVQERDEGLPMLEVHPVCDLSETGIVLLGQNREHLLGHCLDMIGSVVFAQDEAFEQVDEFFTFFSYKRWPVSDEGRNEL